MPCNHVARKPLSFFGVYANREAIASNSRGPSAIKQKDTHAPRGRKFSLAVEVHLCRVSAWLLVLDRRG